MHEYYLQKIKSFEGFTAEAKWDYAQFTNGFGTKARYDGERIDRIEAEARFRAEIEEARAIVERHAGNWDEGTRAALTSLTFNTGTRWISSGLGEAVRNGDPALLRERFFAYHKARGEVLPGLVERRLAELEWIGSQTAPPAAGVEAASASPRVADSTSGREADHGGVVLSPASAQFLSRPGPAAAPTAAAVIDEPRASPMRPEQGDDGHPALRELARALSWYELLVRLTSLTGDHDRSSIGAHDAGTARNEASTI